MPRKKRIETRNVVVRIAPKVITALRRAGLDPVGGTKTKGRLAVRVPLKAKNVRVKAGKGELEVSYTLGKKRIRRVDTPIKKGDWTRTETPDFVTEGRRKGEKLATIRVGVRGYDSRKSHSLGTFGRYLDERFIPSVKRTRGKEGKKKRDMRNFYTVRRFYERSTQKKTAKGKSRVRNV
jgi:hypothetical protein